MLVIAMKELYSDINVWVGIIFCFINCIFFVKKMTLQMTLSTFAEWR